MILFRNNDVLGGAILSCCGAAVSVYAVTRLNLGTIREVGSGAFPLAVGLLLVVLGLGLILSSMRLETPPLEFEFRTFAIVSGSIAVFALTIESLGMVASVLLSTLAASFASNRITWLERMGVAAVLTAIIYVIFIALLGLRIPIFPWSA